MDEKKERERGDTLYFLWWLRLPLPVSDGHWMSPGKEMGVIGTQIAVTHLIHAVDRPRRDFVRE